jgi:hypothetical protein
LSRNGSGTYNLYVPGNPVITGTTISSTWANNTLNDIATALTNSIAKDGQTTPTANLPMGTFKLTGLGAGSAATDSVNMSQLQAGAANHLTGVAGADTITASATPAITAYAAGNKFTFVAAGANTGAVTLNINGLGAKAVTKSGVGALSAGDIAASSVVSVIYDGTQFQLVAASASSIQGQSSTYFTTGGTSTAYTLTPSPALSVLVAGQRFNVKFNATAGATPTLAISGLAAKSLKYYDATGAKQDITSAQVVASLTSDVIYDGTDYVLLNPAGAVNQAATNASYIIGTATNEYLTPAVARANSIVIAAAQATTSGTAFDFPGLPSWAKRVTVELSEVSLSGADDLLIQMGDAGGIETTAYVSSGGISASTGTGVSSSTSGFIIRSQSAAGINTITYTFNKLSGNNWVGTYAGKRDATTISVGGGSKTLSDVLTQVRITRDGTNTFDGGVATVSWE